MKGLQLLDMMAVLGRAFRLMAEDEGGNTDYQLDNGLGVQTNLVVLVYRRMLFIKTHYPSLPKEGESAFLFSLLVLQLPQS